MEKTYSRAYHIIIRMGLSMAGFICAVLLVLGLTSAAKGFLLSSLFSLLNFILMRRSVERRLGRSSARAGVQSFGSILFRYCFLAVPIVLAIKLPGINLVAAIVGLFHIQLTIVLYHLLEVRGIFGKKENLPA